MTSRVYPYYLCSAFAFNSSCRAYGGGDSLFHPLLLHSIDPLPSFFSSDSDSLLNFMEENRAYVNTQINIHYYQQQQQQHTEKRREEGREERDYWLGAAAVFAQFEGMEIILLKFVIYHSSSLTPR